MSHYDYSKYAVVLTSTSRFDMVVKSALNRVGIKPITDIPNLSSLSTISRVLRTTRNTAFIRAELYRFIQEYGFPYIVVMDFKLDVGLDKTNDPDNMKIFRAFLISYLIFSMGRGFEKLHLNLMLLYDEQDTEIAQMLGQKPEKILSALNTRNEKVNELIAQLKKDSASFYRIFTFRFVAKSDIHRTIDDEITQFKQTIESKKKIRDKVVKKNAASVSKEENEPASVFFTANGQLYINGEAADFDEYEESGDDGDLIVKGHWTGMTSMEVSNRIKRSISQAIKDRNFKQDRPVNIHLPEKCIIDGSIASVLAGIVITDLSSFPNKKIHVSRFNQATLSESQGFNMIKEFVVYQ
ncbi:MAG: hypothetical protein ACOC2H_07085 [Spirochaetota bacterium]